MKPYDYYVLIHSYGTRFAMGTYYTLKIYKIMEPVCVSGTMGLSVLSLNHCFGYVFLFKIHLIIIRINGSKDQRIMNHK